MNAFLQPVFQVIEKEDGIDFVFSSNMENIDAVCEKVTKYLKNKVTGISTNLFAINLVLREGLTNAVRHGNAGRPEKKVSLFLTLKANAILKAVIQDEGDGFDWEKRLGDIPPDDADHGRGFLIMETYFTCFRYNKKGNILYLEKELDAPPQP